MKTILLLTDFSVAAQYAAEYALQIALKLKADLLLCNAIEAAEYDQSSEPIAWPIADHLVLKHESLMDLKVVAADLKKKVSDDSGYKPIISCTNDFGKLSAVAAKVIEAKDVDLVIMGAHKSNALSRFLFDSHTHDILDNINCPVLLVPANMKYKDITSIAYGTDLTFSNSKVINYLARLAEPFEASILVSNVISSNALSPEALGKVFHRSINYFYPKVFYTSLRGENIPKRLLEITGAGKADILTLVHKQYGFFESLFHSSISKKMADMAEVPLLILPYSFSEDAEDISNEQLEHYCYVSNDLR